MAVVLAGAGCVLLARQRPERAAANAQAGAYAERLPRLADVRGALPPGAPNVVIICVDTLRADHLGAYGYSRPTSPRIDAFAQSGRVFERAYSTTPFTTPSVVSMLTGLYPYRHGVRLLWQPLDRKVVTLPEWLRAAGYQTAAVVSNLVLSDEACGLGSRFDHYDDAVDEPEPNRPKMLERRAARTTDAALSWLNEGRDAARPFFLWVHYIDPHGPYLPLEDALVRFTHDVPRPVNRDKIAEYARLGDSTDGLDYVDAYDAEIAYADREVGRLMDGLHALGLASDALIVLTADHGEFLLERDDLLFGHGFSVDDAVIHVPLIVRHPSIAAGRMDDAVSIADVAATVLEVVGLTPPPGLDGRSLARGAGRGAPPYAEGPDPTGSGGLERALVYSQRKAVIRHGRANVPRAAWTEDAVNGSALRAPLAADDPAYRSLAELIAADPMQARAESAEDSGAPPSALVADDLSDEAISKLRALGYVK